MKNRRPFYLALLLLGLLTASAAVARDPALLQRLQRPHGVTGAVVVPDTFLRSWDPITVFFPGDAPQNLETPVSLGRDWPGAWTWLDGQTLQFAPAEPWPALSRVTVNVGREDQRLSTLVSPPIETQPANGDAELGSVETIRLTFAEPLPPEAVAEMVSVDLRDLPGAGEAPRLTLEAGDFEVKTVERASADAPASYLLVLDSPIPEGTKATVNFRLSLAPLGSRGATPEQFSALSFTTARPFRATQIGCSRTRLPVSVAGATYDEDQSIDCGAGDAVVTVDFTAPPSQLGILEGKNLLRFEPSVEGLQYQLSGRRLMVRGRFQRDTRYRVTLMPSDLTDYSLRALELEGPTTIHLAFQKRAPYLRWTRSEGVIERLGPVRAPVQGRGHARADVRVHRVDPMDRDYWPFSGDPIAVDEDTRPPGPGEEPPPHGGADLTNRAAIASRIKALGSPGASAVVDLPLDADAGAADFGVDLEPLLDRIAGADAPGHYLVGLRPLDEGSSRSWMRVQVTDLSLTTVEEQESVRFVVTSLATGRPVAGATVLVEGARGGDWATLFEGATDAAGQLVWAVPGEASAPSTVHRISASKGGDRLILDPQKPPKRYADNQLHSVRERWLGWAFGALDRRREAALDLAHLYTERPVYRPEEAVHIAGFVRQRFKGRLTAASGEGVVVISGPGETSWREVVTLSGSGGLYHRFEQPDLPTGDYRVWFEDKDGQTMGHTTFKKDAYRVPRFEVSLDGPASAALDAPFEVDLTASYYAGGRVAGQPVRWRVTQLPYTWTPPNMEGFYFSSDGRYSDTRRFRSTPRLDAAATTDDRGGATLLLDPTIEPTAQPRRYMVEATVTGDDDRTVTATSEVLALPPFVLGVSAPRYIERAASISPQVIALDHTGQPLAGLTITARLKKREWHSYLQASDFSEGSARYVTDTVDALLEEREVISGAGPLPLYFNLDGAGVYLVELEARDELGRAQVVTVDLYAGGDESVSWERPSTEVFETSTDAASYEPGDSATVLIRSPYQRAHALVIVEAPEGNRYQWADIRSGAASVTVPVEATYVPRLPVHVILMRGRADRDGGPLHLDPGKPQTLSSTAWLQVAPVDNQVQVALEHPDTVLPGEAMDVTIRLADGDGAPLAGEVTLWLVDRAVLALGAEQRLDPVPDFISRVSSRLSVRDTRNLAFGALPMAEMPGGGAGEEAQDPLARATIRRNFEPVPYYEHALEVGPTGERTVTVVVGDSLTDFAVRAKATSGEERFGAGKSTVSVRLPLIVQPALPRFVRPGDRFEAEAVARVIEGEGGPGAVRIEAEGLTLQGDDSRVMAWQAGGVERLRFPVSVPDPGYDAFGQLKRQDVTVRVGVSRDHDGAADAFEVLLPLAPDRQPEVVQELVELTKDDPYELIDLSSQARPNTVSRKVVASDRADIVRLLTGLDTLLASPHGGTGQRLDQTRALLALQRLQWSEGLYDAATLADAAAKDTLAWLPTVVDDDGLVAWWPGAQGYVTLTAWTVRTLVELEDAGHAVDPALMSTLTRALQSSLRSDYHRFVSGEQYTERAYALSALAATGDFDAAYFAELSRTASWLDAEGVTQVLVAGARGGQSGQAVMQSLSQTLSDGVLTRLDQGTEIYAGLSKRRSRSGLIAPSETRTLAAITRAITLVAPDAEKLDLMVAALVNLGREDGWGSTNADAEALTALAAHLETHPPEAGRHALRVSEGGDTVSLTLDKGSPIAQHLSETGEGGVVTLEKGGPLLLRARSRWVPITPGSEVAPDASGFVVKREQLRQIADGPPLRTALESAGQTLTLSVGDVVEEHVQVVLPEERFHVAVVVPLAAGMEPMNPELATAPPEARPSGALTLAPTYISRRDDAVTFFYDQLPKGTYDFYFRARASTPGAFTQPPARAEALYAPAVRGRSAGAQVVIGRAAP